MADADPIPFARTALVLAAAVAIVSIALAVTRHPPPVQAAGAGADPVATIAQAVEARPEDAEAWRMLGLARSAQGDYRGAATAFGQAIKRLPGNAEVRSSLGEALALAANGAVTPTAAAAFHAALALDPAEPRARYYLALAKLQGGDKAGAIKDLRTLLSDAPQGATWRPVVQQALDRAAR